ncbi:MAG: hypothetical protein EBT47_03585 [Chloroflexi bacterium]|nr:hypothetical protein [Chloroflexota bacterium]
MTHQCGRKAIDSLRCRTVRCPQMGRSQAVRHGTLNPASGTRMRSSLHKVLHPVVGRTMLWHVLEAVRGAGVLPAATVIVVGDRAEQVVASVDKDREGAGYAFAEQAERLGTGHATLVARPQVKGNPSTVVVAYGDTPLLQASTVERLLRTHHETGALVTLVTGVLDDPSGYGRIVRDPETGFVTGIVEHRDATPEQRAIREINSGFCAFDATWMWANLPLVPPAPNGEIYLTALAELASLVLEMIDGGVTCEDPASVYLEPGIEVGEETVIRANTHLRGKTRIGRGCVVGPNSILTDATIGDGANVVASVIDGVSVEPGSRIGPFSNLCGAGGAVPRRV